MTSNKIAALFAILIGIVGIAALLAHFHLPSALASAVTGVVIGAAVALGAFSRALRRTNNN